MIRDRDRIYGAVVTRRLRAMGPGQTDCADLTLAEWLCRAADRIYPMRVHVCMHHIVVLSKAHRRRVLRSYANNYNEIRTRRSLNVDPAVSHRVQSA
jgi:hypothetical protein